MQRAEFRHDHTPRLSQSLEVAVRQIFGSVGVQEHRQAHARTAAVHEGIDELIGHLTFMKNIGFKREGACGGTHGVEQGGKRLLAVQENVNPVIAKDRSAAGGFDGG